MYIDNAECYIGIIFILDICECHGNSCSFKTIHGYNMLSYWDEYHFASNHIYYASKYLECVDVLWEGATMHAPLKEC